MLYISKAELHGYARRDRVHAQHHTSLLVFTMSSLLRRFRGSASSHPPQHPRAQGTDGSATRAAAPTNGARQ